MADENELLSQDEIERLLQGSPAAAEPSQTGVPTPSPPPAGADPVATAEKTANAPVQKPPSGEDQIGPEEFDALLAGSKGGPTPAPAAPGAGPPLPPVKDADKLLRQSEIDNLLKEVQGKASGTPRDKPAEPPAQAPFSPAASSAAETEINPRDIELLLNQAERALASVTGESTAPLPPGISEFRLAELSGAAASTDNATLDLLRDVELEVKIELGRTNMYLEEVLKLRRGSVVPLDKLAGDPVDIFVNGRLVARGEVLVLNDNFCVRIAELVAGVGPG